VENEWGEVFSIQKVGWLYILCFCRFTPSSYLIGNHTVGRDQSSEWLISGLRLRCDQWGLFDWEVRAAWLVDIDIFFLCDE
jgi:hypothetical protein